MENIKIDTKEQAIEWIHNLTTLGIKPGLARMEWMLERLNHPERQVRFVHVAGTNGKGSTVSYISHVLKKSGYLVGTFTSPYLIEFTNRIQINGEDITGQHLVDLLNRVIPLSLELEKSELGAPTEFEVITVIAILYFATVAFPDIVIWETGLGGRLDSTNVVIPLVSAITNIGYDHMNLLGYDIRDIAKEKAGIIKQGIPVVSGVENEAAKKVIENTAQEKKASLYQMNEQFSFITHTMKHSGSIFTFKGPYLTMPEINIKMVGPHQIKNAAVSLMTLEVLRQYYAFYIEEDAIYSGMKNVFWPGRFEVITEEPTIIIDGAHNPEGAKSLRETIDLFRYERLIMVTGILGDKAIDGFFAEVLPIANELIITEPDYPRAAKTEELKAVIKSINDSKVYREIKDWKMAVETAIDLATADDLVIITGSLYLISDVRNYLFDKYKKTVSKK